jgi:hypothetical protein
MLSEALQRNAKHEARLSNISDLLPIRSNMRTEILRQGNKSPLYDCYSKGWASPASLGMTLEMRVERFSRKTRIDANFQVHIIFLE